jgi:site-specific recombinase XerD
MKTTVVFNRNKRDSEKKPVHVRVYFLPGVQNYYFTKVQVEEKHWDREKKIVKRSHPEYRFLNVQIDKIKQKIESFYRYCVYHELPFTHDTLKDHLEGDNKSPVVVDYMYSTLARDEKNISPNTYRLHESVIRNFKVFSTRVTIREIDIRFLDRYHEHLLLTMQPGSTSKNHKYLRKVLNRALNAGLINKNPYNEFIIPQANKRIVYLSPNQVQSLRDYKGVARVEKVRDLFLFQCLTGMSYSDMQDVEQQHIIEREGRRYIYNLRKKSGMPQIIPIFEETQNIIDRYAGKQKLFPTISNQRMNAYLKELGDLCQIDRPLTTHIARHTFATLMLEKGMPLESVSAILGHANLKTTQIYAKIAFRKISEDLDRLHIESI